MTTVTAAGAATGAPPRRTGVSWRRSVRRFWTDVRRAAADRFWNAIGIPTRNDDPRFEELLFDLNRSLAGESETIGRIMSGIDDWEVVHQKGEGPEVLIPDGRGGMVPRKGPLPGLKYFIAKRVKLVRASAPDIESKTVVNVGASSDLLFRYLGHRGLGINISERAVEYMRSLGIEARVGSAEALDLPDKSFDYLLCFQTLEHLENPVRALREFGRVARERIFLTVPHVPATLVCSFEEPSRGRHRWHVFEFSPPDLRKVMRRAGLRVVRTEVIRIHGTPRTLRQRLFYRRWRRHSWFDGFLFCEAVPDG